MHNIDTLEKYGQSFQTKVISALLTDITLLNKLAEIINESFFESEVNKWIVNEIIDHYNQYKLQPSVDVFKSKIIKIADVSLQKRIADQLKTAYTFIGNDDLDFIKNEFTNFCINQNLKQAIFDSVDYLKAGNYNKIKDRIDLALKAGVDYDLGHDYITEFDNRIEKVDRDTVPTGWDTVNDLMGGGLGPGELAVIVAASGTGKCVGGDTTIDIEYEEIGFNISENFVVWFKPWDKIWMDNKTFLYAYQVEKIIANGASKTIRETVRVDDFFEKNDIPEKEDYFVDIPYELKVSTPYGYYKVPQVCRTIKQIAIRLYFKNNRTLECGWEHKLKVNGDWKEVRDIDIKNDLIETETGITQIKEIREKKEKILYDLSVDKVHCFYSNGVVSHNTWILSKIGADAVKAGKTVVHYTLELSEYYVGQRYDTIFSSIPSSELVDKRDQVKHIIGNLKGKLLIKYFAPKSITTKVIQNHIEKMTSNGMKPDLIIIDYADLLMSYSNKSDSTYNEQGGIYIELRGMGGELKIPTWTASQSNRASVDSEVIEADKIADSYAKVMNSDFIISLSRKSKDKINNTARIHVMKNRFGPDGITFPCKMDTNKGDIEIYDGNSSNGIIASKQSKDGSDTERKLLHKKYIENLG